MSETYKLTPVSVAKELPKEDEHVLWEDHDGLHTYAPMRDKGDKDWYIICPETEIIFHPSDMAIWYKKEPDRTAELVEVLEKVKDRIHELRESGGFSSMDCVDQITKIINDCDIEYVRNWFNNDK